MMPQNMSDSESEPAQAENTATGAIDRLLVVAENLKLLVLGSIAAGLLAYGICFVVPQSYTSQAILSLPAIPLSPSASQQVLPVPQTPTQAAAIMVSPLVLDPIIRTFNLSDERDQDVARKKLADKIKATVGKDLLLRLEVTAPSPEQAQKLANAIIDTWLKSTVPGERERGDLEKRLGYLKLSLDSVTGLIERIAKDGTESLGKPLTRGEAGSSLVALGELQGRYLTEVIAIPRALQGMSRDVVAQPPTLPIEPSWPKKSWIAGFSSLGALALILMCLFGLEALRAAEQEPAAADKLNRLRRAIKLDPRPN
jgi:uncharacterized protein involved in exopolysaccharide biosynthesis